MQYRSHEGVESIEKKTLTAGAGYIAWWLPDYNVSCSPGWLFIYVGLPLYVLKSNISMKVGPTRLYYSIFDIKQLNYLRLTSEELRSGYIQDHSIISYTGAVLQKLWCDMCTDLGSITELGLYLMPGLISGPITEGCGELQTPRPDRDEDVLWKGQLTPQIIDTFMRCCLSVGSASVPLGQIWASIGQCFMLTGGSHSSMYHFMSWRQIFL